MIDQNDAITPFLLIQIAFKYAEYRILFTDKASTIPRTGPVDVGLLQDIFHKSLLHVTDSLLKVGIDPNSPISDPLILKPVQN